MLLTKNIYIDFPGKKPNQKPSKEILEFVCTVSNEERPQTLKVIFPEADNQTHFKKSVSI